MSPAHVRVMRQRERDCKDWAEYADTVFMQLENELNEQGVKGVCVTPGMVSAARARCAQVIGRALAANRDPAMEGGGTMGRGSAARMNIGSDGSSYYYRGSI
jgi:hypothetical protein